jgi:6-phosphofructokinase 1
MLHANHHDMNRIGVFTSGGDSPGMNACIRAVVRTAIFNKLEVVGIHRGYQGMVENDMQLIESRYVSNIIQRGGTILRTARSPEFMTEAGRVKAANNIRAIGVDGLVCIGGDGSYRGAMQLYKEHGIPVVGAPGTIDNDIYGTDFTIGFDTAINTAVDAIDRIRDTANSHNRVFFVEVMGRHTGYIALAAGIAGGAESILIPEEENNDEKLIAMLKNSRKAFSIIVVAEGDESGGAAKMAERIKQYIPDFDPRISILGHIQRGGKPSSFDRVLATRLGCAAVESLISGKHNVAMGFVNNQISTTSFEDATTKQKSLNPELLRLIDILNV